MFFLFSSYIHNNSKIYKLLQLIYEYNKLLQLIHELYFCRNVIFLSYSHFSIYDYKPEYKFKCVLIPKQERG